MINTAQIRAARGLLKWTQASLAHRAALSTVTLSMIENETVRPRGSTLAAIRAALESGGVEFIYAKGEGIGARFSPRHRDVEGSNNRTSDDALKAQAGCALRPEPD